MRGVTGPLAVFEGNKGFMDAVAGPFHIDWAQEDLERVNRTILKKYNAEIHSQSALEGALELKARNNVTPRHISKVEIDIFDVAYHIIGGGEEGDKTVVRAKEEADHSLPYLVAVALLDGQVMPDQYRPERIRRADVQALLQKVTVRPDASFTARFPREMPCQLRVILGDGTVFATEQSDYEGFHTRPMSWDTAVQKFVRLSDTAGVSPSWQHEVSDIVRSFEAIRIEELMRVLAQLPSA